MPQRPLRPLLLLALLGGCVSSLELGDGDSSTQSTEDTSPSTAPASMSSSSGASDDETSSDSTASETTGASPSLCLQITDVDAGAPIAPYLGDVDGDGVPELWDLDYDFGANTSTLTAYTVTTDGAVATLSETTRLGKFSEFVDIDGDGRDDAVFEATREQPVPAWYQGGADATLGDTALPLVLGEGVVFRPALADADGDGVADLMLVHADPPAVELRLGDGAGGFAPGRSVQITNVEGSFGDAGITPSTQPPFLPRVKGFALRADDGAIIFQPRGTAAIVSVDSTGETTVTPATPYVPWQRSLDVGELDGAAPPDILAIAHEREVLVWRGEPGGGFAPQTLYLGADPTRNVRAGDFIGEGERHVVIVDDAGAVIVHPVPIVDPSIATQLEGTLDVAFSYTVIDVDGDGRLELYGTDVVGADRTAAQIVQIVEC